jgi:hypothetical protein
MGCSLETVPIAGLTKLFFGILFLQNDFPPLISWRTIFAEVKIKKLKTITNHF